MTRIIPAAILLAALAGCASAPPATVAQAVPIRTTATDPISGLAQLAMADVQQGIADLVAAGAGAPNAPLPLVDSLTCGNWLLTAIPQAQQISGGIIPSFQAKGAYSAFIEGKIALYNLKGAIGSVKSTFIDTFNHNCGAAVAGDVNAINVMLAKVGIGVMLPGVGGVAGILGL